METPLVRVGIIGVGNCARALLEGTAHYRSVTDLSAGLMFPKVGPYGAGALEPVAAWDVDVEKVGKDLWTARAAGQNLDVGIPQADLLPIGQDVRVLRAPRLDGAGVKYQERVTVVDDHEAGPAADERLKTIEQIKAAKVDVLLNYLPVGSQEATEWWAGVALEAGTAFVNNIPVFIARRDEWREKFRAAGLPLIGDDIKSQLGATYLHRVLVRAFSDRGIGLERTYQLNVGGNMDFYNMLEQDRLSSKRESKTSAVTDAYSGKLNDEDVHIGPSDYVQFLGDTKKAFIRCEGKGFGGAPIEMDMQLTVPDSPNSAGVVIDAARIAKLAMDRGDTAVDEWVSAWLFKAPPRAVSQESDQVARERLTTWMSGATTR
ncbi:inositol-3-phosphate synthase [Actinomadura barringtoniae]|uniref:Inositol-3-phosphate synthase n=1 Tax=Actinomadura barringtoniae TaxID=1427535 RepID=A0A939T3T8_9ACTN|nr:inositol-3-phosphate synthase [Actinomadura barringtoniae]MBO2447204.1 inositol-3-phosphate synthase [Actinomadura barringtoniae]